MNESESNNELEEVETDKMVANLKNLIKPTIIRINLKLYGGRIILDEDTKTFKGSKIFYTLQVSF